MYGDDTIITDSNKETSRLGRILAREFEIKTLGTLKYFLGVEIAHSSNRILISLQKYFFYLLSETGHLYCKPSPNPTEANHTLTLNHDGPSIALTYQHLITKLIYLAHTRLHIAYSVHVLANLCTTQKASYLQAAHKVLRYLKGTIGLGLAFKLTGKLFIEIYSDSDCAGSLIDLRSTSGMHTFLGGNLIHLKSKKPSTVSTSSARADYRAMVMTYISWWKLN